jgi:hypothetical protein
MSVASASLALIQFVFSECIMSNRLNVCGIWCGFNRYVVIVVALQVITGLFIGILLKHADSVKKNFAISLSLMFTSSIELIHLARPPIASMICGIGLVTLSLLLYAEANTSLAIFAASCIALGIDAISCFHFPILA